MIVCCGFLLLMWLAGSTFDLGSGDSDELGQRLIPDWRDPSFWSNYQLWLMLGKWQHHYCWNKSDSNDRFIRCGRAAGSTDDRRVSPSPQTATEWGETALCVCTLWVQTCIFIADQYSSFHPDREVWKQPIVKIPRMMTATHLILSICILRFMNLSLFNDYSPTVHCWCSKGMTAG